jgi:DNA-binding transcriptional ArsR family regulator
MSNTKTALTRPVLEQLADRFKALAEVNRLAIMNSLREGERTVSELMEITRLGQANLSKHLTQLHRLGFVARRKEGLNVYYRLQDQDVFRICDIMCGRLTREARTRHAALEGDAAVRRAARRAKP